MNNINNLFENKKQKFKTNKLLFDDAISLYIITFFLMFMIAMISIWQSNKIDQLRKDIEQLNNKLQIESAKLQK